MMHIPPYVTLQSWCGWAAHAGLCCAFLVFDSHALSLSSVCYSYICVSLWMCTTSSDVSVSSTRVLLACVCVCASVWQVVF